MKFTAHTHYWLITLNWPTKDIGEKISSTSVLTVFKYSKSNYDENTFFMKHLVIFLIKHNNFTFSSNKMFFSNSIKSLRLYNCHKNLKLICLKFRGLYAIFIFTNIYIFVINLLLYQWKASYLKHTLWGPCFFK